MNTNPVNEYLSGVIARVDAEQKAAGSHESWLQEKAFQQATTPDKHYPTSSPLLETAIDEAVRLAGELNELIYILPYTVGNGRTYYQIARGCEVGDNGSSMLGYAEPGFQSEISFLCKPAKFVPVADFVADITARVKISRLL